MPGKQLFNTFPNLSHYYGQNRTTYVVEFIEIYQKHPYIYLVVLGIPAHLLFLNFFYNTAYSFQINELELRRQNVSTGNSLLKNEKEFLRYETIFFDVYPGERRVNHVRRLQ